MSGMLVLPAESPLRRRLEDMAQSDRLVVFAGIPGAGKSFLLQQLALVAHRAGRRVHLFQWDVARSAFETPALLSRYPEREGVTHPMIIQAVGRWIRAAIVAWHRAHPAPAHLLIGEAPLVGRRLIELAEPGAEPAESLLTAPSSRFLVPVPSLAVRNAIESRRRATSAAPRNDREAADAPPQVVRDSWNQVLREGVAAGLIPAAAPGAGYDPGSYGAIYRHWLRHRQVELLPLDDLLPSIGSVYEVGVIEGELRATHEEVTQIADSIR